MIDRRTALAGVAAMFGSGLFAPIARAASPAPKVPGIPVISDDPPAVALFTPAQRALVTALSERVIPTTDTPGAIAAGVPAFIEKLLADWALPADRVPILAGLDAIEVRSLQDYRIAATQATPEQQDALLTLAMFDQLPGGWAFFDAFRQLDADRIVVLPNHANIIRSAQQAITLYKADNAVLIPTKSIPEGYCALAMDIADEPDASQRIRQMQEGAEAFNVLIRSSDGPVSLLVDRVGDVVEVPPEAFEPAPDTLRPALRSLIRGAYKLEKRLLLALEHLLERAA